MTEDDESQSLRQSSGGVRGSLRDGTGGKTAGGACRGPLKDSTVLLILLDVGLGATIW
ncbi:hypothetical protein LguiB_003124 [Lonicera macranthoides]